MSQNLRVPWEGRVVKVVGRGWLPKLHDSYFVYHEQKYLTYAYNLGNVDLAFHYLFSRIFRENHMLPNLNRLAYFLCIFTICSKF